MRLTHIEISKIRPNPNNPRGIDIQTQDDKLSQLKDSINQFGVMVPIVVSQHGDGYMLIDGERRYWASKAIGLDKIPAFIIDENGSFSPREILYRMFQIHHNVEQWGPVQQCHALESKYGQIVKRQAISSIEDERRKLEAIAEEIAEATGIQQRTAMTRAYFLRWPDDIKDRLYKNPADTSYWYICEIEEKIIVPSLINYPEYFEKVPVEEVRRDLFEKLEKHSVDKSTDVRRVAPYFRSRMSDPSDRKKIQSILSQLHSKKSMTYGEAQDEFVHAFPKLLQREPVSPRKLYSLMKILQTALDDFDLTSFDTAKKRAKAGRSELRAALKELIRSLEEFSEELGGDGSK